MDSPYVKKFATSLKFDSLLLFIYKINGTIKISSFTKIDEVFGENVLSRESPATF